MKSDQEPLDLDAAIDRAVRSMMTAEPRPGMRQRVLSRINEAPRRAFPMLRLAMAGGGIAVIALAVVLRDGNRPIRPIEEPARVPGHPVVAAPPPRVQAPAARVPPPVSAPPTANRTQALSPRIPRGMVVAQSLPSEDPVRSAAVGPTVVPEAPENLLLPPLSTIQELQPPGDSVPAITVAPIGIVNLQPIAPLQGQYPGPSR